ncbi:MAG: putative crcb protein [Phycisphaerales bacterium]|nr:putative crcb protein [Phycisphaerales bacterium]
MSAWLQCLTVGAAGFAGAVTRFGLNLAAAAVVPARPWLGTFAINVTGCFALGYFLAAFGDRFGPAHPIRLAVAVGFLGAYTTFSTFAAESDALLARGAYATFGLYVGGSIGLGLLACAAGAAAGR